MDAVRAYFKRAMSSDPLAGNMYDPVRHVQTSEALMSINNQILTFAASNLDTTSREWQVIIFLSRRSLGHL